jgi:hypothetical protein
VTAEPGVADDVLREPPRFGLLQAGEHLPVLATGGRRETPLVASVTFVPLMAGGAVAEVVERGLGASLGAADRGHLLLKHASDRFATCFFPGVPNLTPAQSTGHPRGRG